jgi:hypothetical protein
MHGVVHVVPGKVYPTSIVQTTQIHNPKTGRTHIIFVEDLLPSWEIPGIIR